jgi:anthranilate synthase/aminodeoxychorismate synthase-like glutamine amidotransferase
VLSVDARLDARAIVILLIDNYDSFVHNLARYFRRLGHETRLVRNDAITADEALALAPSAVVLSPGPCTPSEAGCSMELVRQVAGYVPVLGVCLGHQAIGAAFGGRIVRAVEPMHGRTSVIRHRADGIFRGLPNPLTVGRYHSLVVEESSLPEELEVTAWSADGAVMGLAHRDLPVFGVQFHPESVLTEGGFAMLANFLRLAGLDTPDSIPEVHQERPEAALAAYVPVAPVTF